MNNVELICQIKNILFYEWDPIGINEFKGGYDQYDKYIPDIYDFLIKEKNPISKIEEFLLWAENYYMGMESSPEKVEHSRKIAQKLSELKNAKV
jgi:hypothetical protein